MRKENKDAMKARTRNIRLLVSYDGGAYHGFQRQTLPVIGIQNVLEEKLELIFGDTIELAAAGRTDAGVHAYGQVVNFFTNGSIPVDRVVRAVNSLLPEDIVVREAMEVDKTFSARHSAKSKIYTYRIFQGEVPNPFLRRYAWYIRRPLDVGAMQEASRVLLGTHDFSSFRASGGAHMSPVRTMYEAVCSQLGEKIEFRFFASGFLYHMVRNLVGTLVNVGLGKTMPDEFQNILEMHDRQQAGATAPAQGLYLYHVNY
jgi:tRNA pseudouridine38-40 synthase